MDEFFRAYYQQLETVHGEMDAVLASVPQKAVDWQPSPEMNSLAVLAEHTAGAERYWIGDVAGQDHANRVRSQEFETRGKEPQELRERLQAVLAHSQGVLRQLTLADLREMRASWRDEESYSVAWALIHALEHTAMHAGHMQIVRDLWLVKGEDSA